MYTLALTADSGVDTFEILAEGELPAAHIMVPLHEYLRDCATRDYTESVMRWTREALASAPASDVPLVLRIPNGANRHDEYTLSYGGTL